MDYLRSWGVRFLDLFSPARSRRRETTATTQRPQRERQKRPPATKKRAYRIQKHYSSKPWISNGVKARAIKKTTTTHEELEDEWKQLSDECDTVSEYQHRRWGTNSDSEDEDKDKDTTEPPNYSDGATDTDGWAGKKGKYRGQGEEEEEEEEEGESGFFEDGELGDSLVNDEDDHKDAEIASMIQETINEIDTEGWSADELALYCRLRMRGREPMLPFHWRVDFETIPRRLFGDENKVMINSHCENTFRATQALHALFKLGARVRDREISGRPVEGLIKKEIERYVRWSQEDGEFYRKPHIPVLAIVAGSPGQTEVDLEQRIEKKLKALATRYREEQDVTECVEPPPTFYGLIISGIMMGFVTYNSANDDAPIRSIGLFDYSTHNNDVWNGIAIAYLVIAARNYMIKILEDVESESVETSDPDA